MLIATIDKLRCVERELSLRRNVYRKRVATKQMTQAQADREIATMQAIVDDYTLWNEVPQQVGALEQVFKLLRATEQKPV